tara:strand:+ start:192 stop:533 length:342 start_codon:yes stop_codon:yes gene_type:complete
MKINELKSFGQLFNEMEKSIKRDKIEESKIISKIAKRAIADLGFLTSQHMDLMMDIEFAHEENPIEIDQLLEADIGNFAHDIFGIYRNFNRTTKRMENCFVPRYAMQGMRGEI